jgi:hypothetical protein
MKKLVMLLSIPTLLVGCGFSPKCMDKTNGVVLTEEEMVIEKQNQEILDVYALQDSIGENLYKWGDRWVPESQLDSLIELETQPILDSIFEEMDRNMED